LETIVSLSPTSGPRNG